MSEWEPPEDAKPVIVCAAIRRKSDEAIIAGPRHFDKTMLAAILGFQPESNLMDRSWSDADQGFIDQWGRFYDRKAALDIVMQDPKQRSVMRNPNAGHELYSEDLY